MERHAAGTPLFESIVAFDHATVDTAVRALGGNWARRRCEYIGKTRFPLSLSVYGERSRAWS